MKNAFRKDSIRKIRSTFNRFTAILVITAIGVAFFTGLRATGPTMAKTAEAYYHEQHFMDLQVFSTSGFSVKDLDRVDALNLFQQVTLGYRMDVLVETEESKLSVKLLSLSEDPENQVNSPLLLEGKLPGTGECLIDQKLVDSAKYKLGDVVVFTGDQPGQVEATLKGKTYTIVGIAQNPEYLSAQRGNSGIGSGLLSGFFYLPEEDFQLPVYVTLEVTLKEGDEFELYSDEYQEKVDKAKEALKTLDAKGQWLILDHRSNIGAESFRQDVQRIETLSLVMPILFFLISIMVTMTSMTRLVDSDLTLIGTYKALGYGNLSIASRYLLYAMAASLIGGLIGIFAGYSIFPALIVDAYTSLYALDTLVFAIEPGLILLSLAIAIVSAALPAFFVAIRAMKESPAELMRPVAPIKGKVILLERIGWLWKRLNFSQKVMMRNLFRYKKRLIMTLFGVAGCTALMFAGFGLKDSVSSILPLQYESITMQDVEIQLKEGLSLEDREKLEASFREEDLLKETVFLHKENATLLSSTGNKEFSLLALSQDNDYSKMLGIRNRQTGEKLVLKGDGVILSEKLADLYDLKVGEDFRMRNHEGKETLLHITGIMENYFLHYVLLSDSAYARIFGAMGPENMVYGTLSQNSKQAEQELYSSLVPLEGVSNIKFTSKDTQTFEDSLEALTFVVLILILSAAALVFVVLFSLTSINIEERKRELATLKVLGFNQRELLGYVFREGIFLTLVGIVLGLMLGYFLHGYIIQTMEIDFLMFGRVIAPLSYLYSILLTLTFALVVNLSMILPIQNIDMITSLKSIE